MTRAAGRFLESSQLYAALRTIVRTQARELPLEKLPMLRNALRHASWTTSSASVRLPVSQRANPYASSRCGSTTFLKLHVVFARADPIHDRILLWRGLHCSIESRANGHEIHGPRRDKRPLQTRLVCADNHCDLMDCRFPLDEMWVPVLSR